jgi:putative transposase
LGLPALDVDRSELIFMRVYPTRNSLTSEPFFNGVLKYCEGKPEFIVDNAPWLRDSPQSLD